jgi:hypothetical protein
MEEIMKLSVKDLQSGEVKHLEGAILKVGKDPRAQLNTTYGARMHAVIEVSPEKVLFIDLGNEPCSLVNGQKVNKCELKVGDVFEIRSRDLNEFHSFEVVGTPSSALKELILGNGTETSDVKKDERPVLSNLDQQAEELGKQAAKIMKEVFSTQTCNTTDIGLLLKAMIAESADPPAIVVATSKAIKQIRGKVSSSFENEVMRFVLDNEK